MRVRHENGSELVGEKRNEQPKSETHMTFDPGAGPSKTAQGAKTILIVEDNEFNMQVSNDLLEANGYRILQSRDGYDALKVARESKPDLILMDIQLPGMSGLEVAKLIKNDANLRAIPIIAVSAFVMKGDEAIYRQGGCEGYIAKPITGSELLEIVEKYTEGSPHRP